ncbi:MAG: DUF3450 domain-containing protein [Desulfobacteraceae bacterium]|jgi:chromosome segregation ATPase
MVYKVLFTLLVMSIVGTNISADDSLDQSQQIISQTNTTLRQSQKKIDQADEQTVKMIEEYKTAKKEIENYLVYNQQLTDIISSQKKEMELLKGDIDKIDCTAQQIMPFMQKMIDGLAQFIASDFPFLLDERKTRLESLNKNMKRADLSIAVKYRQIMEAYQIEMDYGNTIEAYEENLDNKRVSFLKLGRIGLYYLSLDKKYCAAWNQEKRKWQLLDDMDYKLSIAKAIKIAKKQRAPDLFFAAVEPAKDRK